MRYSGHLNTFNFGDRFLQWSRILFQNFELCTQNNGFTSEWFPSIRSVHQGCPIAPLYYLLCGEIMSIQIKNNQGIDINGIMNVVSQFAYDTGLFLTYDLNCLNAVINTLGQIEIGIGLTVNYKKSSIYRIGSLCNL